VTIENYEEGEHWLVQQCWVHIDLVVYCNKCMSSKLPQSINDSQFLMKFQMSTKGFLDCITIEHKSTILVFNISDQSMNEHL